MGIRVLVISLDLFSTQERTNNIIERIKRIHKEENLVIILKNNANQNQSFGSLRIPDQVLNTGRDILHQIHSGLFNVSVIYSQLMEQYGISSVAIGDSDIGLEIDDRDIKVAVSKIDTSLLTQSIRSGQVPVISGGFTQLSRDGKISGNKGASDLLAVAIASSLGTERCEFWSKDTGVYSGDRRIAVNSQKIDELNTDECMEMAVLGFVLPDMEALELARKTGVNIFFTAPFSEEGTWIMANRGNENNNVKAVAYDTDTAKIAVLGVPDRPGIAATIFSALSENDISAEMIIQSVMRGQINDIAFLVKKADIERAITVCRNLARETGAQGVTFDTEIARVSVIGAGISNRPDIPSRVFSTLAAHEINIDMIAATSISIICVVSEPQAQKAVQALHSEFIE